MEALRQSVDREAAPAKADKPARKARKTATGQKEMLMLMLMLMPIPGKKTAKEAANKKTTAGRQQSRRGWRTSAPLKGAINLVCGSQLMGRRLASQVLRRRTVRPRPPMFSDPL
jgi:hypothetical protein